MGGRGSSSGRGTKGGRSGISAVQKQVIDRLNQKLPVGERVKGNKFGDGTLIEPIKYEPQENGNLKYTAKTMVLSSGVKSYSIGVGDIKPYVRITETTGTIAIDPKTMKTATFKSKTKVLKEQTLTKKEYEKYRKERESR